MREIGEHDEGRERRHDLTDAELREKLRIHEQQEAQEHQAESKKEQSSETKLEKEREKVIKLVDEITQNTENDKDGEAGFRRMVEKFGQQYQKKMEGITAGISEGVDNAGRAVERTVEKIGDPLSKLEQPKEKNPEPTAQELGNMGQSLQDASHEEPFHENAERDIEGLEAQELADGQEIEPIGDAEVEEHSMEHQTDAQVPLLESHTEIPKPDDTNSESRSDETIEGLQKNDATESSEPSPQNLISELPAELTDLNPILDQFLQSDFIRDGYGVAVPLEIVQEGHLGEWLLESGVAEQFKIKHPELGALLGQIYTEVYQKFNWSKKKFCRSLGVGKTGYYPLIANRFGVPLNKLLNLPQQLTSEKIQLLKNSDLTDDELDSLKQNRHLLQKTIDRILLGEDTTIFTRGSSVTWNFHPANLKSVQYKNQDHIIIPTGKWEVKATREEISSWIREFYQKEGKSPNIKEFRRKFGGFFVMEREKYNRHYNDILRGLDLPRNWEQEQDWTDPATWDGVKRWMEGFYVVTSLFNPLMGKKGRSPSAEETKTKYGGVIGALRNQGVPNAQEEVHTYNQLLKYWELPLNLERRYDWAKPATWAIAKQWAQGFYFVTCLLNPLSGKMGRSPMIRELEAKFGGIMHFPWLKTKGIPGENKKIKTFNDLLRVWDLPVNLEVKFDWQNPATWTMVEEWVKGFYVATCFFNPLYGDVGMTPQTREIQPFFPGFRKAIRKYGVPGTNKEIRRYNELLEYWRLPTHDRDKAQEEGNQFDLAGKDCLDILYNYSLKNHIVCHPITPKNNRAFVVPDGIIHDFSKIPLQVTGNKINLEKGQKFDLVVEFKRNYGSMDKKDWEIYTRLAKQMDVYLLRGCAKDCVVNGCQIRFFNIRELVSILQMHSTPETKSQVDSFIKAIREILRGGKKTPQRSLRDFS